MNMNEAVIAAAYADWCRATKSKTPYADLPVAVRQAFEAGCRHSDTPVFRTVGKTTIDMQRAVRAQWVPSDTGTTGYLAIYFDRDEPVFVPFDDPVAGPLACLVGLDEFHKNWPAEKAAAVAKQKARLAAEKAEREKAARERALEKAKAMGFGPLLAPDVAQNA